MKWFLLLCLPSAACAQRLPWQTTRALVGVGGAVGTGGLSGGLDAGVVWASDTYSLGGMVGVAGGDGMQMFSAGPQAQGIVGLGARVVRMRRDDAVAWGGLADLSLSLVIVRIGTQLGWVDGPLATLTFGLCLGLPIAGRKRPEGTPMVWPRCAQDDQCLLTDERCVDGYCEAGQ